MISTYTVVSFFISLFCILTAHCLLTRNKTIKFCIIAFLLNTLLVFSISIYATHKIQNMESIRYTVYFIVFWYLIYFYLVFEESMSKKVFTVISIWLSSTIALLISIQLSESILGITNVSYFQNHIYIFRTCIQILLLLVSYFWISKPYKTILKLVSDKTIRYMSLYPDIAFLLLITNFTKSPGRLTNFNSAYDMLLFLAFIILGYVMVFAGISSASKIISLQYEMETLAFISNTDPLTGLLNRRYIIERLENALVKYNITKKRFAIIIGDIDLFKNVNDTYGHDCGDCVLKLVSKIFQDVVRDKDFVSRWGGEEFLILLPETEIEGARILADRIRKTIENQSIDYDGVNVSITMTFGVTVNESYEMISDTIKKADKALYDGKNKGRNCVM